MKCKYLMFLSLFLISCSFPILNNSENNNFNSEVVSTPLLKSKICKTTYRYEKYASSIENDYLEKVSVSIGSITKYVDDDIFPSFRLCGDSILLSYYGEIHYEYVEITTPPGDYWNLEGEIVDVEYINAEIKKVEFNIIEYNGETHILLNNEKFKFIVTDKEYNFSLVSDFDQLNELYASYYEGVPQAIYSFNPLV